MENLEIRRVPFMGAELMAARDNDGQIWAGVSYICRGIGLSKNEKDRQVKNVQSDRVLMKGCGKFDAGVFDPNNSALALKLDYVPLWLAKINITPTMEQETPELADRLEQYQLRAKEVLAAAFLPGYAQEQQVGMYRAKSTSLGEVARFIHEVRGIMKENGQPSQEISKTVVMICGQFGIALPPTFVREGSFEQMVFDGFKA